MMRTARVAVLFALAGAAACAAPPPPPEEPRIDAAFSASGAAAPEARWWTAFADPGLDRAVETALRESPDLAAARARLDQAEAVARRDGADLLPSVDASASVARSPERRSGATTDAWSLAAGLAAGYEVDLWDRIRSGRDASVLSAAASAEDLQAAAITLSAAVATAWFELAEAREQVRVLTEQVETNRKVLDLVSERFRQGRVPVADVLRQRQLVLATEGLLALAKQRTGTLRNQLAALLGRPPGADAGGPDPAMPELPELPAAGVPAEVLARRPDVRGAWLAVLAADRRLAVSSAARLPRLSLAADLRTSSPSVRDLFDGWLVNLAANLAHPLFDGGKLEAEEERGRAVVSEAVARYGGVVLAALREVEDALVLEAGHAEYLASLTEQLRTSREVVARVRESYLNGQADYLRVLDALSSEQSLARQHLTARRQRVDYRIRLNRALAGPIGRDEE